MTSEDLEGRIGRGLQLFRIRHPERYFEQLADLGPMPGAAVAGRRVWRLRGTGTCFALLSMPYKDVEEILVRADSPDWGEWDWEKLADRAEECRWRGPGPDDRWI